MANYYLVSERIVPPFTAGGGSIPLQQEFATSAKRREFIESHCKNPPQNYRIAKLDEKASIYVVFIDVNYGKFLIKAPNQEHAYSVFRTLEGFFSLFTGDPPDLYKTLPKLIELCHVPNTNWTPSRLYQEVKDDFIRMDDGEMAELSSGRYVDQREMSFLGPYVEAIYADAPLAEALNHLGLSRNLFYGNMTGSYYSSHYRHDRVNLSRHEMRKRFLEFRERYELAFLAAFKAIERFLNVNQIQRKNIQNLLRERNIPHSKVYKRFHEIFSGHKELIGFEELISHFLDLRNTVAAHANRKPPDHLLLSEDTLYEIQMFVVELCSESLGDIDERELPKAAILRS